MNPQKTTIAILTALSVSLALADDFKTNNGKEYKDATVTQVEPDGIVVKTKSGISKLYFQELPKHVSSALITTRNKRLHTLPSKMQRSKRAAPKVVRNKLESSGWHNSDKMLRRCNFNYKRFNKKNTIRLNKYV